MMFKMSLSLSLMSLLVLSGMPAIAVASYAAQAASSILVIAMPSLSRRVLTTGFSWCDSTEAIAGPTSYACWKPFRDTRLAAGNDMCEAFGTECNDPSKYHHIMLVELKNTFPRQGNDILSAGTPAHWQ